MDDWAMSGGDHLRGPAGRVPPRVAWGRRAANLRAQAIRQITHEPLAEAYDRLTVAHPAFQERFELLVALGAYREAELILAYLARRG
jgi:hypothetical protein